MSYYNQEQILPHLTLPNNSNSHFTIIKAFERQMKGKKCPVCNCHVQIALYREHLDICRMHSDSDCEIIEVLTGEESRALRAGSPIELDDDGLIGGIACPETVTEINTDYDTSEQKPIARRRSKRLLKETDIGTGIASCDGKIQKRNCEFSTKSEEPKMQVLYNGSTYQVDDIKQEENAKNKRIRSNPSEKGLFSLEPAISSRNITKGHRNLKTHDSYSVFLKTKNEPVNIAYLLEEIEVLLNPRREHSLGSLDNSIDSEVFINKSSPYFVNFVLKMMYKVFSTVKQDGSLYHDNFWGSDIDLFKRFLGISEESRNLFMRIFLRKRVWLPREKLRYTELANYMDSSLTELVKEEFLDDGSEQLMNLEEVLKMASLNCIRTIAKKFQLDATKNKLELVTALNSFSLTQKGLFGLTETISKRMLNSVKEELGPCYRVNRRADLIFNAIFTLYAPTEMNSSLTLDQPNINIPQNLLFTMLQMKIGQIRFPAPNPCLCIISIYDSKEELISYIEAKEIEIAIANLVSTNKLDKAFEFAQKAREILADGKNVRLAKSASIPDALRRFTEHWILFRCVSHGATILEKQKKYGIAINWQRFLLKTEELRSFCMDLRGALWDRLTLNLDAHMKERDEAMNEIIEGMRDNVVKDKDKLLLQDRAMRITRGEFVERITIMEPIKKEITAWTLSKSLGDSRVNRFILKDKSGEICTLECSVEEVVRRHYLEHNDFNQGIHDEGSIWHTTFGILFYDIIYGHNYPCIWLSELQTNPIDLNSTDLYGVRKTAVDERLNWIESCTLDELKEKVITIWNERKGEVTNEINWEIFEEIEDFVQFLACCPRSVLSGVFFRLISDFRSCRSGFPDLTLWNTRTRKIAVVEVKGPGDRLSTKQRLWLHYFTSLGVRAEVCHVKAKNARSLTT